MNKKVNKILIFLLVFCFVGCNKKPQKKNKPVTYQEKLQKAKNMLSWGLKKEAETVYQSLLPSHIPTQIRIEVLKDLGQMAHKNSPDKLKYYKQLYKILPKDYQVQKNLFDCYYQQWSWQKIEPILDNLVLQNPSETLKNLQLWIPQWEKLLKTKMPVPSIDTWKKLLISHHYQKEYEHFNIDIEIKAKRPYFMTQTLIWNGSSCQLQFDIKIKEIPEHTGIRFGIENHSKKGLFVYLNNVGGSSTLTRLVQLNKAKNEPRPETACVYDTGIWYHFSMTYLQELKKVRLEVSKYNNQKKIIGTASKSVADFASGKYLFGFIPYVCKDRVGHITLSIKNIKLSGTGWRLN